MEIWKLGTDAWIKEPFEKFPASQPLNLLVVNHQFTDEKTDHYLVFSEDEEKLIAEMAIPFMGANQAYNFLQAICSPIKRMFTGAPYVMYVGVDLNVPLAKQKEWRIGIHFNDPRER